MTVAKKVTHTPLPWQNLPSLTTNAGVFQIQDGRGVTLAWVQGNDRAHNGGHPISMEVARANGRIMAAAPRLLMACKDALQAVSGSRDIRCMVAEQSLRDAISEAEPRD
jgi:hypothetical protein